MSKLNRHLDPFTNPINGFEEEPNPEVELAFVLQNVQPGDQRIPAVLVGRYASEFHQFIEAGLETHRGETTPEDEIQETLQQTFTTATSEVDRFWGKDSVRNWLFSIALKQIRKMVPRKTFPSLFHRKKTHTGQQGEIYTGQELYIPLTKARLPISMSNLNCDENPERVQLITNPDDPTLDTVLSVVLETISEIGLFHETWQYTIAEERMRFITRPYLLGEDICEPMISFTDTPSTSDTGEHRLYF